MRMHVREWTLLVDDKTRLYLLLNESVGSIRALKKSRSALVDEKVRTFEIGGTGVEIGTR